MTTVADIAKWMQELAPLELGESWDNVGLTLGDPGAEVSSILTCLTVTPATVNEAIVGGVDMLISHHPIPFKPLKQITTDSYSGNLLWRLAKAGVSVYSPHTAWDSAEDGINALLAQKMGLDDVKPLVSTLEHEQLGCGRVGVFSEPQPLQSVAEVLLNEIPEGRLRWVGSPTPVSRVAIACGSGGSLLPAALEHDCQLFLTGEATFHTCLEVEATGICMAMLGHFASERFSMVHLATLLKGAFPGIKSWAARNEKDPVRTQPLSPS